MKNALLALVVLFGSFLAYGQAAPKAPPVTPPSTTAPAVQTQPIIEAGGLDDRCQVGLNTPYNFGDNGFGANNPEESAALSNASTCIGYIAGWAHTLSGAFITRGGSLWYVEISDSFNPTRIAADLHTFLKASPEAREKMSPLVLLKIAVDEGVAEVTQVEIKSAPSSGPAPSTSKKAL